MKARVFLADHPFCCFCGGEEIATTIEHLPARIVFPGKHRPKGLEFPACSSCNNQTRGDDSVLAVVARALGSMRPGSSISSDDVQRAARGARGVFPGFKLKGRQEHVNVNGVIRKVGIFDVNHPTVHLCLCRLAAKFALTTFYHGHGRIADGTYRINTLWTHNQNNEADELANILRLFPNSSSLSMGSWDTADTFYFRDVSEGKTLVTAAVFYESVLLYGQLAPMEEARAWMPYQMTWSPVRGQGLMQMPLTAPTRTVSHEPAVE